MVGAVRTQQQNNKKSQRQRSNFDNNCCSGGSGFDDLRRCCSNSNSGSSKKSDEDDVLQQLLPLGEAPAYLRFNPYITAGYRGALDAKMCLKSILWWTNESVNIWSHLGGFLFFVGVALWGGGLSSFSSEDLIFELVSTFLVLTCFQLCMLLSCLYHTFCCMSEGAYRGWLTVDLFGVSLALFAIYVSGILYAFECHQGWLLFYVSSVVVIFLLTVIVQIIPPLLLHFRSSSSDSSSPSSDLFRWRLVLFTGWGAYGVVPILHFLSLHSLWDEEYPQFLLPRILGMYGISVVAFVFYISKFPERTFRGRVNFLGTSHQLWHLLIFTALAYWVTVVCGGVRNWRNNLRSIGLGVCPNYGP